VNFKGLKIYEMSFISNRNIVNTGLIEVYCRG